MATLYLIPTVLSEEALHVIPSYVHAITSRIRIFIVEDERTARRYLRKTGFQVPFEEVTLLPLNDHTTPEEISHYITHFSGEVEIGLMSEAGVPAVADPGSIIVRMCHQHGIRVVPMVGPSSILLALMASGMNGQRFMFHGYIPVKQPDRKMYIQYMESQAKKGDTQICIETPYRNNQLLQDLLSHCNSSTLLCIALDITGPHEHIRTQTIAAWKKQTIHLEKVPAVFVLGS
jgi:16S rRNA (cytidine1402-2'-O)-methyltransferase